MSFILESIKQAERERKLGQQAPSIAIEYSGAHVEDIENNKMKWVIMSLALLITALVVWGATQYFANKDRQYMEQYVEELASSKETVQSQVSLKNALTDTTVVSSSLTSKIVSEEHDVQMVPVKNVHTSDLKSVKLISADEEAPKTKIKRVVEVKKPVANRLTNASTNASTSKKAVPELKPIIEKFQPKVEPTVVADKQSLAEIYSDLSQLQKQERIIAEPEFVAPEAFDKIRMDKESVQIETASYVTSNENTVTKIPKSESYSHSEVTPLASNHAPKHAIDTGVPSFGELPYDIQEKMPDFNVSVHMFHADPNQRRIRINGNMYTEGKSLQQDLALVEITRYGAVFDYQGHKFRLNVR